MSTSGELFGRQYDYLLPIILKD